MSAQARRRLASAAVVGAVLTAISCVSLLAATLSWPLALVGIAVQSGWFADTVDQLTVPVLRPLLIGSLVLMIVGFALRGRAAIALAVIGSLLVYLAMFVLPSGAAAMLEMGMSTTEPEPIGLAVFWLGVVSVGAAFLVAYRRPVGSGQG